MSTCMCFLKYTYASVHERGIVRQAGRRQSRLPLGAWKASVIEKFHVWPTFSAALATPLLFLHYHTASMCIILCTVSEHGGVRRAGGHGRIIHAYSSTAPRLNCTSFCDSRICQVQMSKLMKANRVTSYKPSLAARPISLLVCVCDADEFFVRAPCFFFRELYKLLGYCACARNWKSKEMPPADKVRGGEICCIFIVRGALWILTTRRLFALLIQCLS